MQMLSSSSTNINTDTNFISISDAIASFESTTFIDGSWHLAKDRNAVTEYENGPRIKGAYYFNIDDVATKTNVELGLNPKNLPHMMPQVSTFEKVMDAFNISTDISTGINTDISTSSSQKSQKIVVYVGSSDCAFGSRAYYTLKSFCGTSNDVYLLQGSLAEWVDGGGPIETGFKEAFSVDQLESDSGTDGEPKYKASGDGNTVTMDEMLKVVSDGDGDGDSDSDTNGSIIIDARGGARFRAEVPEARPGLRGGHMPGALNVPFTDLLEDGNVTKFKAVDEMKKVFEGAGVDIHSDKRIICTCGSGVTACVLAVGLNECGRDYKNTFIYDGSWIEWVSSVLFYLFLFVLFHLHC